MSAQMRQGFDRAVEDVDVGIVNRTEQYPCGPLLLNAAIAKQSNVPKSVGPRSLLSGFGIRLQAIYRGGGLFQVSGGNINFNGGGAHAQVVRIQAGHEEVTQTVVKLDYATPSTDAGGDLLIRSAKVVDRTLQQQLSLALRRHLVQSLELIVRPSRARTPP